jgi:hypothetical protein
MATTTNYSWTTPDDTDLVKDGAAAIRTLGSSADTTVKDLNPGTTAGDIDYYTSSTAKARVAIGTAGQVLKVNSGGTAPEWATTADQTPLTTKGDLFTFTTEDARIGVGADGTVLTAASGEATGLQWAAPAAGGAYTSIASGSFDGEMSIRMNNDSNSNRHYILGDYYPFGGSQIQVSSVSTSFKFNANNIDSPDAENQFTFRLNNYSVAQKHTGIIQSQYINTSSAQESYTVHCYYYQNDAITEVNLLTNQTFSGGTYILYGVK